MYVKYSTEREFQETKARHLCFEEKPYVQLQTGIRLRIPYMIVYRCRHITTSHFLARDRVTRCIFFSKTQPKLFASFFQRLRFHRVHRVAMATFIPS